MEGPDTEPTKPTDTGSPNTSKSTDPDIKMEDESETAEQTTSTALEDRHKRVHEVMQARTLPDSTVENSVHSTEGYVSAESDHNCGKSIQTLLEVNTTAHLGSGYTEGLEILKILEKPLKDLEGTRIGDDFISHIRRILEKAAIPRTIIGVLGNTGSGKSSLINALLDMEKIVPTSCMRACTSVVTEISYDYSESSYGYHAHIEFIGIEDWENELKILRDEIIEPDGTISRDVLRANSEAAVAYAKIRAVYPHVDKKTLVSMSTDELMNSVIDQKVLGQSRHIQDRDAKVFYGGLKRYVDSKAKGSSKNKTESREFEYWPLIKVVKIHLKADILSTGAVLVDLPGVQDSNAARSAVAEEYMKNCTSLWIIAPITRAVDDKVAKELLGDAFKEQLKFDGSLSAITFICSKTDDFSLSEAQENLELGPEFDSLEQKLGDCLVRRTDLVEALRVTKNRKKGSEKALQALQKRVKVWEALDDDVSMGRTVYAPGESSSKRERSLSPANSLKRHRKVATEQEFENHQLSDKAEANFESSIEIDKALDTGHIESVLAGLQGDKKAERRKRQELSEQVLDLEEEIHSVDKERELILTRQTAIGIQARSEYSRRTIQLDFAAGIRETDQQTIFDDEEEGEEAYNTHQTTRDYETLADNLPVFCVSSRAYQKLLRRLKKDNKITGFGTIQQTEIPQLQTHCKELTESGRQAHYRQFLNSVQLLSNSLELWASSVQPSRIPRPEKREEEQLALSSEFKNLKTALNDLITNFLGKIMTMLIDDLTSMFGRAAKSGSKRALGTASGWGDQSIKGSLKYQTYKATVRRNGAFHGAAGERDFNRELLEPMTKRIAPSWDAVFNNRIPAIFQEFNLGASDTIRSFFTALERLDSEGCCSNDAIRMLVDSLQGIIDLLNIIVNSVIVSVSKCQKDVNREFKTTIISAMEPVYGSCTVESGTGSFKRMKSAMANHLTEQQHVMFHRAGSVVEKSVLKMHNEVEHCMSTKFEGFFDHIEGNLHTVMQRIAEQDVKIPEKEKAARESMKIALVKADKIITSILNTNIEVLKARMTETTAHANPDPGTDERGSLGDEMDIDTDELAPNLSSKEETCADDGESVASEESL